MWIKFAHIVETYNTLTCQRWSVTVACLIYFILFSLVVTLSLPLRSLQNDKTELSESAGRENELTPARLETIRLKRDNNLDSVRKELGKEGNADDPRTTLENIFRKADADGDGFLSLQELSVWINNKIQEHITQALQENFGLFTQIDNNPRNGVISWNEYHTYFLKQKGFSNEYVEKHKSHKTLTRSMKEAIMRDRASWSEAARSDPEHLTLDEFLAFRHPESSHATILALVDELFDKFDRDGDEILTEEEFSSLQTEGDGDKEGETLLQGKEERRKEFKEVIDKDKNGRADRMELLMYIDPKNPRHAREEAQTLMALSDVDHDGQLSLPEILNKMDLFLGSKMVDTARSFHDEF